MNSELVDALIEHGLAKDTHWAEELVKHGCFALDGEIFIDPNKDISVSSVVSKVGFILQVGKRRWLKVLHE